MNSHDCADAVKLALFQLRNKLAGRKTMTNAQKQFRQIRNEMELIQRDRNLNSDQKRERIDRLLSKRNNFAAKLIKRFGTEL